MKALFKAVQTNNLQDVKELISIGVDVNISHEVCSPLYVAVEHGFLEMATILIEANANVNAVSKYDGMRPLHAAALVGHSECVKLLVTHKANITLVDNSYFLPFFFAIRYDYIDCVRQLFVKSYLEWLTIWEDTPLCLAVRYGSSKSVEFLLDNGAKTSSVSNMSMYSVLISKRKNIRRSLVVFFKTAKKPLGNDMTRLIAHMIWKTRNNIAWLQKKKV